MTVDQVHCGSCLCGAVTYQVTNPSDVTVCHCSQCRRTSGHLWAAASVPIADFRLTGDATPRWFQSSPEARRGFCTICGSSLFWELAGEGRMHVAPGTLDGPTGLRHARHIFTGDAGDYYSPEGQPPAADGDAPGRLDCACLCGCVAFSLPGPASKITACHCTQCRKLSGYYAASFDADETAIEWQSKDSLVEYETPARGRRGFCSACGSSLYFRSAAGEFSVEAGSVTGPTGGRLTDHIFVADKGDYYAIDDGLPQHKGW